MKLKSLSFVALVAAALTCSAAAYGQEPPPGKPMGFHRGGAMEFGRFEMGLSGKTVTGAPYSAQIVSQRSETLSDGTHITQQDSGAVYRDSAGRVRQEMSMSALRSFTGSAQSPRAVFITDPVAGYHYVLHADSKAVERMPLPSPESVAGRKAKSDAMAGGRGPRQARAGVNVSTESLGTQTIEGIVAEGTRITKTFAPGSVGNDKAIQIVTERWYSQDLQTVVLLKRSDPWMGDSTVRLTNITRTEPAAAMFAVPSEYAVKDRPAPPAMGPRGGAGSQPKD
ncbi:MAG TPA: hypothetical protein VJW51_01840 [Candidatus Acidoferrales bacterium]|nr:hypothetical protein [Candidatus Acidoferrales bacterium]